MPAPALVLGSVPVLLGGAVLAIASRSWRWQIGVALTTQAAACAMILTGVLPIVSSHRALDVVWPWPEPIGAISFHVDALSAFFLIWSLPMTLLGTVYATGYLRAQVAGGRNGGPHLALLNMTSVAFVLIYSVQNALVFLLGWEIAAVAAWLLVIWEYRNQKIRFAGFNYLVSTHVGLFVLVAAFMLLHSRTGSMDFTLFGRFLEQPSSDRTTILVLLWIAFALKSAFFPFHTWLPRAHSAAPAHVSALMSGVIHKAGLFGFLRFTLLAGKPEEWMGWAVLGFGVLSALFGALYTAAQRDLKRLLGYSSTENVGLAAMGFGLGYLGWSWGRPQLVVLGFTAGLLHVLNHAVFKCLVFYAAGAVYRLTHTVDLERLGGLARRMPGTAALFLIGGLAMCGLPPFNGFISEFLLYAGLLGGSATTPEDDAVLVCAAALLAFVGAVAMLSVVRAFGVAFLGNPRDASVHVHGHLPPAMGAPMIAHAALAIALGVAPAAGLVLVRPVVADLAAGVPGVSATLATASLEPLLWATRAFAVALLIGVALTWRARSSTRASVTWGCGATAPAPRTQYTGRSFAAQLTDVFRAALPVLERRHLPRRDEPFPQGTGHVATHHVDAVERRMFEVIGQGEQLIHDTSERIPEEPRVSFLFGLIAVLVIAIVAMGRAA